MTDQQKTWHDRHKASLTTGQRAADIVRNGMGSWPFVGGFISALELRGVTVLLKGVQPQHLELVTNVGVIRSLRHHKHLFSTLPAAVEHARSHVRRNAGASS